MKKLYKNSASAAIVALAITAVSCNMDSMADKALHIMAKATNSQCPIQVDQMTSFDSVAVSQPKIFGFFYSVNVPKDSLDVEQLEGVLLASGSQAVMSAEMEALRKLGTTFQFTYYDVNAQKVCQVEVTPEMYKTQE